MSTTVELPDGHTATLKNDDELTNRQVRLLRNSAMIGAAVVNKLKDLGQSDEDPESWIAMTKLDDGELDKVDLFQRVCVLARLESWTLERDLPTTDDDVDDLPRNIYVPLVTAATDIKWSDDFTPAGASDPKVATARSGNSRPRSKAKSS